MKLYETLFEALKNKDRHIIAITGGGGKTTLLKKFSTFLKEKGYSVLITTSVKVQNPLFYDYEADFVFKNEIDVLSHEVKKAEKVFYAEEAIDLKKFKNPRYEVLSVLFNRYDYVLYEADGSRGLPLKYHSARDPVIYDETTSVIAIMGSDGIGEMAYSVVFGDDREKVVDSSYLNAYIRDPEGLFKGMRDDTENIILINKADEFGLDKLKEIESVNFSYPCFVCSEEEDAIYKVF